MWLVFSLCCSRPAASRLWLCLVETSITQFLHLPEDLYRAVSSSRYSSRRKIVVGVDMISAQPLLDVGMRIDHPLFLIFPFSRLTSSSLISHLPSRTAVHVPCLVVY